MNLKAIIEGLLFVVGDEGLTIEQIAEILDIDGAKVESVLNELKKDYEDDNHGLKIKFLGNTYKLTTKEEHKTIYQKLLEDAENNNLSQAALEILAIIVYNQPITRVQVDSIRGINSSQMIRKLVAKGFVKEVGRSELPGRPILYEITNEFLDYFGLASVDDLPTLEIKADKEDIEETNLFLSRYQEE